MATVITYDKDHIDGLFTQAAQTADGKFVTVTQSGVFLTSEDLAGLLSAATANSTYVQVVDAGTNLDVARPLNAVAVLFRFSAGIDVGANGAAVTNGMPGDFFFVANA